MSSATNTVMLTGRLMDVRVRKSPGGALWGEATLVERLYDGQTRTFASQYHTIKFYGKKAEYINKVDEGRMVAVVGELRYEKYKDKHGNERVVTKIKLDDVQIVDRKLTGKKEIEHESYAQQPAESENQPPGVDDLSVDPPENSEMPEEHWA